MSDRVVLDGELSLTNQLDGQGGTYSRYDWRGYSAYEIAVQHGYTGTEEEWLASLHGTDGQDGDDYVITEQDYQNIANLVPAPEVPVASADNFGTLKIASNATNSGLELTNDGYLRVYAPTEEQIKRAAAAYMPIVPTKQHISAFYGFAKAAGDTTQSQSSNAVGTYTDEAKISIQKMLGLYKGPYRLIKAIEITEETGKFGVLTDENGDPFSLTDLIVYFENVVATGKSNGSIIINAESIGTNAPCLTISNVYNTTEQYMVAKLSVDGGRLVGHASASSLGNYYAPYYIMQNKNASGIIECGLIESFYIGSLNAHKFVSGTITVYGR